MGSNTRSHTRVKINKLLLLCLNKDFLDLTTDSVFRKSCDPKEETELSAKLAQIDWKAPLESIIKELKPHKFDTHTKAVVTKLVFNNAMILPHTLESRITWRVLRWQLQTLHHGILKKTVAQKVSDTEKQQIQTQFLQFMGQLCKEDASDSAQAIHNFLYLAKIVSQNALKNKMDATAIGTIFGSLLLDGLELDGQILPAPEKDPFASRSLAEEYILLGKIATLLLDHEFFKVTFNEQLYALFQQTTQQRQIQSEEMVKELWGEKQTQREQATLIDSFSGMSLTAVPSSSLSAPDMATGSTSTFSRSLRRLSAPSLSAKLSEDKVVIPPLNFDDLAFSGSDEATGFTPLQEAKKRQDTPRESLVVDRKLEKSTSPTSSKKK